MKSKTENTERTYAPNHYIHDIQPNDIIYEETEADFIERCPHDKENPYVVINREILRNPTISPACRWLICYLLCNEKGWRINRRQVANHVKEFLGRDRTDHIFEEAMNAGYMKKVNILVKRKGGGALRRCKYYISETPKFKNCFQSPRIQGSGAAGTDNQGDKEIASEELSSQSSNISPLPPLVPKEEPLPKKKSLRSEEEDLSIYKILDDTVLSPNQKKRLCKQYTEPEVERAVKIAKSQKIKTSLMGLLLSILNNPEQWEDPPTKTQPKKDKEEIDLSKNIELADKYNTKLKEAKIQIIDAKSYTSKEIFKTDLTRMATKNKETLIEKNYIHIILDGFLTKISLSSFDFEQDIKDAIAQLR